MKTAALAITLISLIFGDAFAASPDAPAATPAKPSLKFQAYDGHPTKTAPKDMTFQVNTPDIRQPSQFLKLGETIAGTKLELLKFEFKTRTHPKYGEEDVSELTVINIDTRETLVLTITPIIHAELKPK